uniref:Oxidoreductase n=1 Tax=Streptomyces sp. CNQ-418 TaxID=467194 RepID=J7H552_9ACTN|nr:oxidoreductase [Streptomyces sp. CNQ-418]
MTFGERTIALGTMGFGTTIDERASFTLLDRFVERGGTVLDTANNYAFWNPKGSGDESETTLGRWFFSRRVRDQLIVGTKCGARPAFPGGGLKDAEGLSEQVVRSALDDSLRRMHIDHIDVFWAHVEDRTVPLAETVGALATVVESGKARALGLSNHPVWRAERARALAGDRPRCTNLQYRYSYLQPRGDLPLPASSHVHVTPELLDFARTEPDLRLWVYSSLLSGAYTREDVELPAAYDHPGTPPRLTVLREVARELGVTENQVVLSWLLDHDPAVVPIVGVSRVEQVDEAMDALRIRLEPDQRRRLDEAGTQL